jgi:glycosyltransferase involved in cell wall biosynthesis
MQDWFFLKHSKFTLFPSAITKFISALNPDVVLVNHYSHIGIEIIRAIRNIMPSVKLIMAFHEYMAICNNQGQMIKVKTNALCYEEKPSDCHECFPDKSINDFWLRKYYIQNEFKMIDVFISPSVFLKDRYVNWGLAKERIHVIENILDEKKSILPRKLKNKEKRNRFAFFGQINKYKGVVEILRALKYASEEFKIKLQFELHGTLNISEDDPNLLIEYHNLTAFLIKKGILVLKGPYEPNELMNRMAQIDWVVVPSIWWENSPVVIQEAFSFKRPIICSDIGGMKEKVRHHFNGIHVSVGNIEDWAKTIAQCANDNLLWDKLYKNIKAPSRLKIKQQYLELLSK